MGENRILQTKWKSLALLRFVEMSMVVGDCKFLL